MPAGPCTNLDFPVVWPESNRPFTLCVTATDRCDALAERRVGVSLDPTAPPVAACDRLGIDKGSVF